MKYPLLSSVVLSACALTSPLQAELLSEADRESLTRKLDIMINQGKDALTKRQAAAYQAYRAAMGSESAALDLYLNCVEKVDFIEAGKKSSDFRSWKSSDKAKDKLSDPGFRCALRHQLNWLVLSIEAARLEQEEKPLATLSSKAKAAIDNIYQDAQKLGAHHSELKQDVTGSVFAKAYGFGTYRVKDWPTTPLNIAEVYESIVFPALREERKPDALRTAWKQRIMYQELMLEHWSKGPESKRIGMKRDVKPPAYYKFVEQEKPNLIWQMELDVFDAGDERGAAGRMLSHIQANMSHNNVVKWVKELHELISPGEPLDIAQSIPANSDTGVTQSSPTPTPPVEEPPEPTGTYIELTE